MLRVVFLVLCLQEHNPTSPKDRHRVAGEPQMAAPGQAGI